MHQKYIYLDHAAATPLDSRVLAVMQPYFADIFYNPSALYEPAVQVARDIVGARARVAGIIGARPAEIIFTAGGTEANNIAIHGVMQRFPGKHIVVSSIEHDSVLAPAHAYDATEISADPQGRVQADSVLACLTDDTVLVSVQYANNEIGTVQPIHTIARVLEQVRKERRKAGNLTPLYFHTDACQAPPYLDLHVSRLGVDLMTLNGGKIYGPKQSGALYIAGQLVLKPLLHGGGQEKGVRSGTENVAAIIGFAKALELVQADRNAESERLLKLRTQLTDGLSARLPQVTVTGSPKFRLPNNVHITVPGADNERLLMQLDAVGILAAAGSACSASSDEPSHVLKALGFSDDQSRSSLRFTLGHATDEHAISTLLETLQHILPQ